MYKAYTRCDAMYSIKAATLMTGVSSETLRAWERRYGAVAPRRDENGRRVYAPADITRLKLLHHACQLGHAIGRLALMSNEQLTALVRHQSEMVNNAEITPLTAQLIDALRQYRVDRCEEILGRTIAGLSVTSMVKDVVSPALKEVGEGWFRGEISVGQEHIFSALIHGLIHSLLNIYKNRNRGPKMIFTTPSGERHEFGLLFSALLASHHGADCYYLGADLPLAELKEAARQLHPRVVVLSVVRRPIAPEQIEQVHHLATFLEGLSQLWLGGGATGDISYHRNCVWLSDLDDFNERLQIICAGNR